MSKLRRLTVDEVLKIIELDNKNYKNEEISKMVNVSTGLLSLVIRGYNGNKVQLNKIGKYNRDIVIQAKESKNQNYEVKLLFGLITLKVYPV